MSEFGEEDYDALPARDRRPVVGKRVLYILLPVLFLIATLGGLYLAGVFSPLVDSLGGGDQQQAQAQQAQEDAPAPELPPAESDGTAQFYDLPDILVNLSSGGRQNNYLRLSVSVEVESPAAVQELQALQPRIVDAYTGYLRELRMDELRGSGALYRMKEELVRRANLALDEHQVRDVQVRELLVQ